MGGDLAGVKKNRDRSRVWFLRGPHDDGKAPCGGKARTIRFMERLLSAVHSNIIQQRPGQSALSKNEEESKQSAYTCWVITKKGQAPVFFVNSPDSQAATI